MYRNCSELPEIAEILQFGEVGANPAVKKRESGDFPQVPERVELLLMEFIKVCCGRSTEPMRRTIKSRRGH